MSKYKEKKGRESMCRGAGVREKKKGRIKGERLPTPRHSLRIKRINK